MDSIMEYVSEVALKADGFDDAIIGVSTTGLVVYDYNKCLNIIMKDHQCDYIDAIEYMEHNVVGCYMGEGTPIFINTNG
jgi:hypothetical protein